MNKCSYVTLEWLVWHSSVQMIKDECYEQKTKKEFN